MELQKCYKRFFGSATPLIKPNPSHTFIFDWQRKEDYCTTCRTFKRELIIHDPSLDGENGSDDA